MKKLNKNMTLKKMVKNILNEDVATKIVDTKYMQSLGISKPDVDEVLKIANKIANDMGDQGTCVLGGGLKANNNSFIKAYSQGSLGPERIYNAVKQYLSPKYPKIKFEIEWGVMDGIQKSSQVLSEISVSELENKDLMQVLRIKSLSIILKSMSTDVDSFISEYYKNTNGVTDYPITTDNKKNFANKIKSLEGIKDIVTNLGTNLEWYEPNIEIGLKYLNDKYNDMLKSK
jgi:hypothetical protein